MDELEALRHEVVALRAALEHLLGPLIAAHPKREELLGHLSQYRRQVVGSRDPTKVALAGLLDRVDQSARRQLPSWD